MLILKRLRNLRATFTWRRLSFWIKGNDSPHPLFDATWYKSAYSSLIGSQDPWRHYLYTGAYQGCQPNPLFDSDWYLRHHPELVARKINPLLHYVNQGIAEGADPHPLFSTQWYLRVYPDVALAQINPLFHYLAYGAAEGRDPSRYFDTPWYVQQHPDVDFSSINPLAHYLGRQLEENHDPNPFFDTSWYLSAHPDVRLSNENPLIYFLKHGDYPGQSPSPYFDSAWYQAAHNDLSQFKYGLFKHFLEHGRHEGRSPAPGPTHFTTTGALREFLSVLAPTIRPVPASANLRMTSIPDWLAAQQSPHAGETIFSSSERSNEGVAITDYPIFPSVTRLRDTYVVAGSRYVIATDDVILHDEESHFYNIDGSCLKYNSAQRVGNEHIHIKFGLRQAAWISCGIDMMHEYSTNYFHFIAETMPRIMLAEEAAISPAMPYLFEDNLHHNIRGLLKLVNNDRRPVLWLEPGTLYRVNDLYFPSDVTTVVDAYDGGPITLQTTLDVARIRRGVKRCKEVLNLPKGQPTRRIFAARNGGIRQLLNQGEFQARLSTLNFEPLGTDELDLESQIRTFQEASIIVGPTGAQMTNMVWCQAGTKVIILASDHPSHQLYFWQLLGRVSGVDVQIIQGPRAYTRNDRYSVHDDYTVDIEEVVKSISSC